MFNNKSAGVVACLLLAGGITACSSTDTSKSPITPSSAQAKTATDPAPAIPRAQSQTSLEQRTLPRTAPFKGNFVWIPISFHLSADARASLKAAADWLKKNPTARIEVEGHCDDRGTNEYNLALGAKRAQTTAKDYIRKH